MRKDRQVEILAPAGSFACFQAAMNAGADAVYAAGARFGARAYANNFTQDELIEAIERAHIYGKKFYLTVNTLLKDHEIAELYDYLAPLYEKGLDAVIVQDTGVFQFIRSNFPDLDIHASTQMTITGAAGAKFLESQGAARVVPARELSLEEVRQIHETTDLEVECFVHGALCYCYSGQCLMSSVIGGRSGNRGQCAQPCRLPYTVDGQKKYFLSLKDICTLELIPELVEAGIDSFKIEGRMKKPEYVAAVTAMYRKYVDLYLRKGKSGYAVKPEDRENLMDLYNRADSDTGYYKQHNGREMLALDRPNHAGVEAARCLSQNGREVTAQALTDLHAHDVLEIGSGKDNYTLGKKITKGEKLRFLVPKGMRFKEGFVFRRIRNEELIESLDQKYRKEDRQEEIYGFLSLQVGYPASFTVCCREFSYTAYTEHAVERAQKRPLEEERIRTQLAKTGGTLFFLKDLEISMDQDAFLPMQQLNSLRRAALDGLRREIATAFYRECNPSTTQIETFKEETGNGNLNRYSVFIETEEQLEAVFSFLNQKEELYGQGTQRIGRIALDFRLFGTDFSDTHVRDRIDFWRKSGVELYLVFPHIFRENAQEWFGRQFENFNQLPIDGVVIRNFEAFFFLKERGFDKKIILDHNLYIFNQYGKEFWKQQKVEDFTAPLELNSRELRELDIRDGELLVYGRIPVMVSAQCIERTTSGCSKKLGVRVLQDRRDEKFFARNYCDLCYNVIYTENPINLRQEWDRVNELYPKMRRIQFTLEDKEQTETVLNTFFLTDEKTVARGKEDTDFTTGHFNRGII